MKDYPHFIHNKTRVLKVLKGGGGAKFSDPEIKVLSTYLSFAKQHILKTGIECRMFILGSNSQQTRKERKLPKKGVMSISLHWAPEA